MADWTKKKLHIGCQNDAIYILDGSPSPAPYDGPVPRADGPEVVATPNWRHSNYQANADRLVACWNACLDMNDPAAEIAALRAENERLRASNGELHADLYGSQDGSLLRDTRSALERSEARVKELEATMPDSPTSG